MLGVVERVVAGRALEDDRVELKAAWPSDHRKAARRIAGHANQAGGDSILWLVGVDEGHRVVVEAEVVEMSEWWAKTTRWFDEVHPALTHLSVPTPHGTVQALLFGTARAPYVVTTGGDRSEREVPWREGTRVRSARRSELLRSVVEEAQVPTIECHGGSARFSYEPSRKPDVSVEDVEATIYLRLHLYFETAGPCTLPAHRWKGTLQVGDERIDLTENLRLTGPKRYLVGDFGIIRRGASAEPDGTIRSVADSGLHVGGNDAVVLETQSGIRVGDMLPLLNCRRRVTFTATFPLAGSARHAHVSTHLYRVRTEAPASGEPASNTVTFDVAAADDRS